MKRRDERLCESVDPGHEEPGGRVEALSGVGVQTARRGQVFGELAHRERQFAARAGRRTRVITPIDGDYPLIWLLVERVVSVNTAAAGGNATLMTLEPA